MFTDEELDGMLLDTSDGHVLTFGAESSPCIVDQSDELMLEGVQVPGGHLVARTTKGALTAVQNSEVSLDGTSYRVSRKMDVDDGKFELFVLGQWNG